MNEIPTTSNGDILVVDDNVNNLKTIEQLLIKAGHQVRCASNGRTALMLINARLPEVIFLDVRMPEMNGFELCALIKTQPNCKSIPVIFLSAAGEVQDKIAGFNAGGVDYILKPFDVDEILVRLQTHLKLYRLQQALSKAYDHVEHQVQERTKELRESEERLKLTQEMAHLGSWDWDPATNRLIWSDEVYRIFGLPPNEYNPTYESFLQRVHADDRSAVSEAFTASTSGNKAGFELEHRVLRDNGEIRSVHEKCLHVRDESGRIVRTLGMMHDISDRKQMENKLREAQKMEAIGHLAGGVAHDFNNILVAIMMQLNLLQSNRSLDQEVQDALQDLLDCATRAASLTRQLLMFSRRSMLEIKTLDINDIVSNLLKMLGRVIGEHINLGFESRGADLIVEADAGMLEQVLMNLTVNARDAMPKGGRLLITTDLVEINEQQAGQHTDVHPGRYVLLAVSDTGCGMDEVIRKRIFEPFFTTKDVGKGTGLGLATVYGIVAQHKGWIDVESQVNQGTIFRVYLPASNRKTNAPENIPTLINEAKGDESILVVEDEVTVRNALVRGLKDFGYRVYEAANGQEAVNLWQKHGQQIDLLLSDMIMPEGMTGVDLATKLVSQKPGLKVIISSGYNTEISEEGYVNKEGILYLPKPYQLPVLKKMVRECLDH